VSRYGREDAERDALETAGWEFLSTKAGLERTTSYTEINTVLARRTGVREFDFELDSERRAMGELLGQLSERSFAQLCPGGPVDLRPRSVPQRQRRRTGILRARPAEEAPPAACISR